MPFSNYVILYVLAGLTICSVNQVVFGNLFGTGLVRILGGVMVWPIILLQFLMYFLIQLAGYKIVREGDYIVFKTKSGFEMTRLEFKVDTRGFRQVYEETKNKMKLPSDDGEGEDQSEP